MTDFHELYRRYAKDIYRFSLFLCGNQADAEDITAETFARILTGKSPLIEGTVKGYLLTAARNVYLEAVRRRAIGQQKTQKNDLFSSDGVDTGPEESLTQQRELTALIDYLQTFSETDRAALLMRSDGLSYAEIANRLEISVASAKVKVHRLRMTLTQWRSNQDSKDS